ncbi:zinc-binding dehydrogenase [Rhodoplanes sp. Z2-YC6860]|uniref:zinc-binding dehydrogenase n=1 Tax=Rhodoplanes sp. Z2-YC6860 TaxID=674703 RepID=UPI00078CFA46|nr:zinc-binding dehydrogenase [Rhodoplanes sp. Z2-YC6860]AMN43342.1 zinc-binding alcohol dehydrogenase [Rhodoplanes sp. Z2-YC6860]
MKAWVGSGAGADVRFELTDFPMPVPAPGEVLVRVQAAGINRVDQYPTGSHFRHSPPAPAAIPGIEAAGEVVEIGHGVEGMRSGDRVAAMVQGGCAEFVRMNAALAIPIPADMRWSTAAALPVSYLTAFNAMMMLGRLPPSGSLLVHAVTSGVGIAALQLAVRYGAAIIMGSSTSPQKLERLRALGLHLGLADPYAGFADSVLQQTGGKGADLVLDNIGGSLLNETMRCTALGGTIVNIGRLGGINAEIDLNVHAVRRIRLLGATFRSRSLEEHASVVQGFLADHATSLADGTLAPLIDSVFAFDDLPAAVARSLQREQLGKIVVERTG